MKRLLLFASVCLFFLLWLPASRAEMAQDGWTAETFQAVGGSRQTPMPTYTPRPSPSPTSPPFNTLHVPWDFPTIQGALNEAVAHTHIIVSPGIYRENLVWPHMDGICLLTEEQSGSVTVDGHYSGRVITVKNMDGMSATVQGLRLTRGKHPDGGAGMFIENASVLIQECEIFANEASVQDISLKRPGIECLNSDVTLIGCHIHHHLGVDSEGSALTIDDGTVWMEGCRFSNNNLLMSGGYGSAVSLLNGIAVMKHCEFYRNNAENGSIVYLSDTALMESCLVHENAHDIPGDVAVLAAGETFLLYNTLSDNDCIGIRVDGSPVLARGNISSFNQTGIAVDAGYDVMLEVNDVFGNGEDYWGTGPGISDFSLNPLFISGPAGTYYLSHLAAGQSADSPCIDAGDDLTEPYGLTRTDHVPDTGIMDVGFHRNDALPEPPATWTPTPAVSPTIATPTPTAVHPTETPEPGTLKVPEEYPNIQAAVDAASNHDIISVAPGTYTGQGNRDISFRGKDITVTSRNGALSTIIDCGGSIPNPHRGFLFESQESPYAKLKGFTIRNGVHVEGGGILILNGANPVIQNCIIENCRATSYGGGMRVYNSSFILENSQIMECTASDGGGGLAIFGYESSYAVIYRTLFQGNDAHTPTGGGGGIYVHDLAQPFITSCIFENNNSIALLLDSGSVSYIEVANCLFTGNCPGLECRNGKVNILNCTFAENGVYAVQGHPPNGLITMYRSCLWGPEDVAIGTHEVYYSNLPPGNLGLHNFYRDPLFTSGPQGNYYIRQSPDFEEISPNVNTGGCPAYDAEFQGPGYSIILSQLTTSVSDITDARFSDIGYHYYTSNPEPTPTPQPPIRPIIEDVLGSSEDFQNSQELVFHISAQVEHPNGPEYIESVELYLDNIPLNIKLYDDGTHGDTHAEDGRYSIELHFAAYLVPPREYLLNVVAFGKDQKPSVTIPYIMSVEGSGDAVRPSIAGRYSWFTLVESGKNEMGFLWILARLEHPFGRDHIARVEMVYSGYPTGILLYDDGLHQDINAGDGYYGGLIFYNGIQIPEPIDDVIFDIQATDTDGNISSTWPIAWKCN